MKNQVSLDFRDNAELQAAFAKKKVGEKCTLTVKFQVDEMNDEGVRGTIEEITPEGYESAGPEKKEEIEPDSESPVMLAIVSKNSKPKSEEEEAAALKY